MFAASVVVAEIRATANVNVHEGVSVSDFGVYFVKLIVGTEETADLAESLPVGMQVLAYLNGPFGPELNEAKGYSRTPGSDTIEKTDAWQFAGMQGFVVQDGENLIWPSIGSQNIGALTDARPGGKLDGLTDEQRQQAAVFEQQVADSGTTMRELYSTNPES